MRRLAWTLAPTLPLALACAAGPAPVDSPPAPVWIDDATAGDLDVDLVDRAAELDGAQEYDLADVGEVLDLRTAGAGALLDIDADPITALEGQVPAYRSATYGNALQGVQMALAADVITGLVLAPPAAAIAITANGVTAQVDDNLWVGTHAVSDGLRTVTGTFVVAWVGVGWVAEMRLSSSDGQYQDTRWFTGFVSADRRVGWWDLYDGSGARAGVVEWLGDPDTGDGEFGIAALTGDAAGDALVYAFLEGDSAVAYWDASRAEDLWVHVAPDGSGDLRSPDYLGGSVACWAGADDPDPYHDVPCP